MPVLQFFLNNYKLIIESSFVFVIVAYIAALNISISVKDRKISELKQDIYNHEQQLEVIGFNVNSELSKKDTDANKDIIDINTTVFHGTRRLR